MQEQITLLEKYRKTQTGKGWHTAPDDGYLYDHLLHHLKEAGLNNEIKALFIDHNWLNARAKQSGYDAYLSDLEIAWEISQAETLNQIEMNEEPVGLIECFRYVVIQTTLVSIAENHVAELVARALETNLWTPTKALSLAALVPEDHRRAEMYTKLLQTGKLDEKAANHIRKVTTDIVQSIEYAGYRLSALMKLAPHLEKTSQKYILGLAVELALEQADQINYPDNHAFWWLSEQLEGDLLEQARVGALAIRNPISRVWSLTRLARLLDEPYRQNALEQAVISAENISDELQRANALAQLAEYVTGNLIERVLELTLEIEDQRWHGRVLEKLVTKLNEEQLTRTLDATLKIQDFFQRWRVLENIATVATGETRNRALDALPNHKKEVSKPSTLSEKIDPVSKSLKSDLKWIVTIEDDEDFYERLRPLIQEIPDNLLPKVLKRAEQIEDRVSRDLVFGALSPRLSANLLVYALKGSLTLEDRMSFLRVLTTLSHQVNPPLKRKIQSANLKAILSIHTPWQRVESLVEFLPTFEGKEKLGAVEKAVRAIEHLANGEYQARMLASIIPSLPENQRQEMLTSALNLTWSYKTTAERLNAAGIQHNSASLYNIDMEIWQRIRILSLIIDHLGEPVRTETLIRALDMTLNIESETWRSATLSQLARHLKGELLERALDALLAISSENERLQALNDFIPHLPPSSLLKILDLASKIDRINWRVMTLIKLAKQFDAEQRDQILVTVLDLVMQENRPWTKINNLAELSKLGVQNAAQQGIEAAQLLTDEWERAQALAIFVPLINIPDDILKKIHLGLLSHFQRWRTQKQEMLFQNLVDEVVFSKSVLSAQILNGFATDMLQIYQGWEWT